MAMGRRGSKDRPLFVAATELPRGGGHPFYAALNRVLDEAKFDEFVEELCRPAYKEAGAGRRSIPPGVYFRMLMVGYFEGIDSQRGIAWRCSDSLSLREFLGVGLTQRTPDHSTLTLTRKRLSVEVHREVFTFVVGIARKKKLLRGKRVGVDATTLEANAAMKSIARRDTGESWDAYILRLAEEEGIDNPTVEDARRLDRRRKGKKTSNTQWESKSDPESRITKMKDGRTHLAYKAEHAVDLDTELLLATEIYRADQSDGDTMVDTLSQGLGHVLEAGAEADELTEVAVGDKGYHKTETLAELEAAGIDSYIPERRENFERRWSDKPAEWKEAFEANRARLATEENRALQRLRSERVERSFAHTCESGGARRSWLRGADEIQKRYSIVGAAHNLALVMRSLFGVGKPKALQGLLAALFAMLARLWSRRERLRAILQHPFVFRPTDHAHLAARTCSAMPRFQGP